MMQYLGAADVSAAVDAVTSALAPYLPLIGIIVGSVLIGLFNSHNRRKGAQENLTPDVAELWNQQALQAKELDHQYRWRRRLQNYADELLRTYRHYVQRVQGGGTTEMTPHERMFYESEPPSDQVNLTRE